jgi:tRNA 2-thiouridine synthesizing protein C
MKKIMFVNRCAPYGTFYAREAIDVLLMAAAFNQDISAVFLDDGVFQLLKNQQADSIHMKSFASICQTLTLYDIDKLYVEQHTLVSRNLTLEDLVLPVESLSSEELSELMHQQDIILNC